MTMVRNSTDSVFVPLLTEIHGRELITNEIARVRELSDEKRGAIGLRPEDLDTLDDALRNAREQFHLIYPKLSGLHGILFKLFQGEVPDMTHPRDGALVIEKVFERIEAEHVEGFLSGIRSRTDLSSVALEITRIDSLRSRFIDNLMMLGRNYLEDHDTSLFGVTTPDFSGSSGDIMAFNFSMIRRIELFIVSQAFDSVTTFYANGRRRHELIGRVAALDPNCPPIKQRPEGEGGPSSGGAGSTGGAPGPEQAPSSGNDASSFSGIARNSHSIAAEPSTEIYHEARLIDPESFFDSNPTGAGAALFISLMAKPVR